MNGKLLFYHFDHINERKHARICNNLTLKAPHWIQPALLKFSRALLKSLFPRRTPLKPVEERPNEEMKEQQIISYTREQLLAIKQLGDGNIDFDTLPAGIRKHGWLEQQLDRREEMFRGRRERLRSALRCPPGSVLPRGSSFRSLSPVKLVFKPSMHSDPRW